MSIRKPEASARWMVWALWQSLQTGSSLSVLPTLVAWMLLLELLLDAVVALAAGGGHVGAVDARAGVAGRQHAVGGVAAGAGGGHGQAALQQALAVDALGVGLDDAVLLALVAHGGLLALAVAAGAELGDVVGEGGRAGVDLAQDLVGAVALLAGGGVQVAVGHELAVPARRVLLGHLGVAGGAVDLLGDGLAGPLVGGHIHLRVALRAGHLGVARVLQVVGVHGQRSGRPSP